MSERAWRWDSEDYARHSGAQGEWARELLAKLEPAGTERALDIGSGDGRITAELAALLPRGRVLGLDSSPEMVRLARRRHPPRRHPNLRFRLGSALELDFAEAFDLVFSNAALHWVHDHPRLLRGVARALRPGGRLLFQMGGQGNGQEILDCLEELAREPPWEAWLGGFPCPWTFPAPQEYRLWLAQAGLAARRVELLPKLMRQQGPTGLAGWIRTTWLPYTQAVPPERREELVAAIVERYLRAHPPDGEGTVRVRMVRLEVEACREPVQDPGP